MNSLREWSDSVPCGWADIFNKLCEDVESRLTDKELDELEILDVKEKYGSLRIYHNMDKIDDLVNACEKLTAETCINCGKHATHTSKGWILPFCDDCPEE